MTAFVYDCKNCEMNEGCGYTYDCLYEYAKQPPPKPVLDLVNTTRLIHNLPLYDAERIGRPMITMESALKILHPQSLAKIHHGS